MIQVYFAWIMHLSCKLLFTQYDTISSNRQEEHHTQGRQLELHEQRYEPAPPLPLRNSTHSDSVEPPAVKEKAIEANLPPAIASNDYECVGFNNLSFASLQSGDNATVAELVDSEVKTDIAEDST